MWHQYDFILNTDVVQNEQELEYAKQSLDNILEEQAASNGPIKFDPLAKTTGRKGGFITLLDIFRERHGFISFVIIQNNLRTFPVGVRERMVATAITLHAWHSNRNDNQEYREAFEMVLAHLAEVGGGITLQQKLLALY